MTYTAQQTAILNAITNLTQTITDIEHLLNITISR